MILLLLLERNLIVIYIEIIQKVKSGRTKANEGYIYPYFFWLRGGFQINMHQENWTIEFNWIMNNFILN